MDNFFKVRPMLETMAGTNLSVAPFLPRKIRVKLKFLSKMNTLAYFNFSDDEKKFCNVVT
jgi:hypothetical protein